MNPKLVRQLSEITEEEREILSGKKEMDHSRYTENARMVVDRKKLLDAGKMIQLRMHSRFMHFPRHRRNYIKAIYMCRGETIHLIDGKKLVLKEGEILFLHPDAVQEMYPAGESDLAVHFIILPEFFRATFQTLGEKENLIRDFLVNCLCEEHIYDRYLHFQVADVIPVQNLIENLVWTMFNSQPNKQTMNQMMMGLLFMQLANYTERLEGSTRSFEQNLLLQVLRYIDGNYRDGQLSELSVLLGYDIYWLSRTIKKLTGKNYKDLLQIKRLNQAEYLLMNTGLAVSDVSAAVGYDNTSYFHRIFRDYYKMSPKEYRRANKTTEKG